LKIGLENNLAGQKLLCSHLRGKCHCVFGLPI
jgi:hypothetical protein